MPITNKPALKSAMGKAKAKIADTMLFKGKALTFTNRLYAIVDKRGRLSVDDTGTRLQAAIYTTRKDARDMLEHGERVVRLNDITGLVQ